MEITKNESVTITFTRDELRDLRLALLEARRSYQNDDMPASAAEVMDMYWQITGKPDNRSQTLHQIKLRN